MCKEDTELSHIPCPPSTCRQLQDASLSCKAPQIHAKSDGWLGHAKAIFTAKASSRELNCRAITAILSPTMCKEDTELSHIPCPPSTCRQLQDASLSCKAPQIHAKSDGWLGHARAIFTAKASSRELNCRAITAIFSPTMLQRRYGAVTHSMPTFNLSSTARRKLVMQSTTDPCQIRWMARSRKSYIHS